MSFGIKHFCVCALSAAILTGCAGMQGKVQIDPSLHTVSKADYESSKKAIELPQNYSTKNYKRLVVATNFFANKDASSYSDLPLETVSTMMETEISKLKRFTIVSRHLGQKGKAAEKRFQDMGTTDALSRMRFGKGLNADYGLVAGVSAVKEEYNRVDHNEVLYIIRVDYQLIDFQTDEIIEADSAEGRAIRTLFRLPSGKVIGGFDQEQEQDALNQASINALKIVANKIGNKLPIGGQVVGFRGSNFQIDKGYESGFMGKQIVTLYMSDMGVDLPLAIAEVSPGADASRGKIIRWSNDPDVQDLVAEIKADPLFFKKNELFAVSNGMPLPPEWEDNYKD
ncbi:hypothetical protein [Endozoicomonas acroporae]|uniref:hypothetical protein n=1 Tax=Endozoicomonas acroporae TaxID=1701104 RepID=UPI003D78EAA0